MNQRFPVAGGRPPKTHDNIRVRAFLIAWSGCGDSVPEDRTDDCGDSEAADRADDRGSRWLGDILTGVSWLQSEKQNPTRPLNRSLMLRALMRCDGISASAVKRCIGRGHKKAQVYRYRAATEVASRAIEVELDRRHHWVQQVLDDAAYCAELDAMV